LKRSKRRRAGGAQTRRPPLAPTERDRLLATAIHHHQTGRLARAATGYRRLLRHAPRDVDALNLLGVLCQQRGDGDEAERLLLAAIAVAPERADPHYHLGEVLRARGAHPEAIERYRQALAIDPRHANARFNLANALFALGDGAAAVSAYREALELTPADAELHNNLGVAVAAGGDPEVALKHYDRALRLRPDFAAAEVNRAAALRAIGRLDEAVTACRQALRIDHRMAPAYSELAACLEEGGHRDEAQTCLGRALTLDPTLLAARIALGRLLIRAGRPGEAQACLRVAAESLPARPDQAIDLGQALTDSGLPEQAAACFEQALARDPGAVAAHVGLGVCFQQMGRFDEAARAHRAALAIDTTHAGAGQHLALMHRLTAGERARLDAALGGDRLTTGDRTLLHFALGSALDQEGRGAEAFAHFRVGNRLVATDRPFDPVRFEEQIASIEAFFDAAFFAAHADLGHPSRRAVLIVGMPRSGSTLVERILGAHPNCAAGGELDALRIVVRELPAVLGDGARYPECLSGIDSGAARRIAERYLAALPAAPDARLVTDKLLGNFLHLGLLAVILPQAQVIHCRRDPLDTCLSCYFQHFAHGLRFTYDLDHLAIVYRAYQRLMAHWRTVLPMPIHEVCYEDLVAQPETEARRLLEFCGLAWDPACLSEHAGGGTVRTASFWQVRQPVYRSSVGRWRAYRDRIGPLLEGLGNETR